MSRLLGLILTLAAAHCAQGAATLMDPSTAAAPSARQAAGGSAMLAVSGSVESVWSAPSVLGTLGCVRVSIQHAQWMRGATQQTVQGGLPMAPGWGLGLELEKTTFDNWRLVDPDGGWLGDSGAQRQAFAAGLAAPLAWGLEAGAGARAESMSLGGVNRVTCLGSASLLAPLGRRASAVASVRGLGAGEPDVEGAFAGQARPLGPLAFTCGVAVARIEGAQRLRLGVETLAWGVAAARAGYQRGFGGAWPGGSAGLSMGVGLDIHGWQLDYDWLDFGDAGQAHRLGLVLEFEDKPPRPAALITDGMPPLPEPPAVAVDAPRPSPWGPPPEPAPGPAPRPMPTATPGFGLALEDDAVARGGELEAQGRVAEALALYRRAVVEAPADIEAWRAMARLYARAGRGDWAQACWRRVAAIAPGDAEASRALLQAVGR